MDASLSTSSSDPTASRGWRPWGAVAAIVVCFVVEVLVLLPNRLQFTDPLNSVILEKRSILETSVDADFAVLGDSRFFHLPPSSLGTESSSGINLSWAWCGYEAYDVMLKAALKAAPGVRRVYVPGSPEIISYSPENVSAAENADYRERLFQAAPLSAQVLSFSGRGEWKLLWDQLERAMMPPSYVYGPALITRGKDLFLGDNADPMRDERDRLLADFRDDGAFAYAADTSVTAEQTLAIEPVAGPFEVRKNYRAISAFEDFLNRAKDAGVAVVMLPMPIAGPLYQVYEDRGVLKSYDNLLAKWEIRFPHFEVAKRATVSYPVELFVDPGHLNSRGREQHVTECREVIGRNEL